MKVVVKPVEQVSIVLETDDDIEKMKQVINLAAETLTRCIGIGLSVEDRAIYDFARRLKERLEEEGK